MTESAKPVTNPTALLSEAALKHGVVLTSEQVALATEWRGAMEAAVDAVRRMDVKDCEPAAAFVPVAASRNSVGG